eukprot:805521-Pelagomonas_calceolata.AAC.2
MILPDISQEKLLPHLDAVLKIPGGGMHVPVVLEAQMDSSSNWRAELESTSGLQLRSCSMRLEPRAMQGNINI